MSTFKINEIFLSLQGEGFWTGTAACFVRFSGCNLACPFCDTQHEAGTHIAATDIAATVGRMPARHVVLTGGEPAFVLTADLIDRLHEAGKFVAVETNGTRPLPPNVNWITLSPKQHCLGAGARPVLTRCNELKVVHTGGTFPTYEEIQADHRFIQPCDCGDAEKNRQIQAACIEFCQNHPAWRLSLQTHKLLGIR